MAALTLLPTHQTSHIDHSKFIFPGHISAPIWCEMDEHLYLPSLLLAHISVGVPATQQEHAQLSELNAPLLTIPASADPTALAARIVSHYLLLILFSGTVQLPLRICALSFPGLSNS